MAISINCCLKPSSPPTPSPPFPSQRLAPSSKESANGLRLKCLSVVAAATCLIIGLGDVSAGVAATAVDELTEKRIVFKWTDGIRGCPPWRHNLLENYAPENLPRRSDRRRTDGFVADQTAPVVKYNRGCYSL